MVPEDLLSESTYLRALYFCSKLKNLDCLFFQFGFFFPCDHHARCFTRKCPNQLESQSLIAQPAIQPIQASRIHSLSIKE